MKILVVFESFEGHTGKIARAVADRLLASNVNADVLDATVRPIELNPTRYDAVIVAAPVHQRHHPDTILNFILAHSEDLAARPTALISVSLAAAFPDGKADARSYVETLVKDCKWQPTMVHLAAGALRNSEYDFFQEQIIRHVVLRDRAPDQVVGDQEFTDWDALGSFVDDFVAQSRSQAKAG